MVILRDALIGLSELPSSCSQLVLTDLPSGETRAPFDVRPDLSEMWSSFWKITTPNGIVVLMASSLTFASDLVRSQPDTYRYDLVWHKSLATGHLNSRTRPLRAHEFVLVFSKSSSHTYRPQMTTGASPLHPCTRTSGSENYDRITRITSNRAGATDRHPTSVLRFPSVGTSALGRTHPQQKPVPLLEWLISTYSMPGDLVVDPYAGSGSTGVASEKLGRRFVGFDSCPRFGYPTTEKEKTA